MLRHWPILLVVYLCFVGHGLYSHSQREAENAAKEKSVKFEDDLLSASFFQKDLPLIKGETIYFYFQMEVIDQDTVGCYLRKHSDHVKYYPWGSMSKKNRDFLLKKRNI